MRTEKQNEASKHNSRKSKGPVTPEGKAIAAQNAIGHNLCIGHLVLLSTEDPGEFHQLMIDYFQRFQPIDGVERDVVHKMIAATWREKRVTAMESSLFELEMDRQEPDVDDEFDLISPEARQVLTLFGTTDATAAAALLFRYGATARRAFSSAYRLLKDLQGDRFGRNVTATPIPAAPEPLPAEQPSDEPADPPPTEPAEPPAAHAPQPVIRRPVEFRQRVTNTNPGPEITKLPNEPKRAFAVGQNPPPNLQAA